MLIWLIISVVIGGIVAGITGLSFLFWVVFILLFMFGLPGVLISGFIHGENEYSQDRADYRETMRQIAEDERMERYLDKLDELKDDTPNIFIDNRKVNFYLKQKTKKNSKGDKVDEI